MADKKKKPWQFSLGRALGIITLICVTLAVPRSLASAGHGDLAAVAILICLGSTVGAIVGGKDGAVIGAIVGLMVSVAVFIR